MKAFSAQYLFQCVLCLMRAFCACLAYLTHPYFACSIQVQFHLRAQWDLVLGAERIQKAQVKTDEVVAWHVRKDYALKHLDATQHNFEGIHMSYGSGAVDGISLLESPRWHLSEINKSGKVDINSRWNNLVLATRPRRCSLWPVSNIGLPKSPTQSEALSSFTKKENASDFYVLQMLATRRSSSAEPP